jgi:hypothetical protein
MVVVWGSSDASNSQTLPRHSGAHRGSRLSLQTQQINPEAAGDNDWKAGIYQLKGVESLAAFASATLSNSNFMSYAPCSIRTECEWTDLRRARGAEVFGRSGQFSEM